VSTDDLNWRKSSFSGGGNCIEVADLPDGSRGVRDSKDNESGPVLRFTSAEWQAFVAGVKDGQFD
jgi:hypothetical protein